MHPVFRSIQSHPRFVMRIIFAVLLLLVLEKIRGTMGTAIARPEAKSVTDASAPEA